MYSQLAGRAPYFRMIWSCVNFTKDSYCSVSMGEIKNEVIKSMETEDKHNLVSRGKPISGWLLHTGYQQMCGISWREGPLLVATPHCTGLFPVWLQKTSCRGRKCLPFYLHQHDEVIINSLERSARSPQTLRSHKRQEGRGKKTKWPHSWLQSQGIQNNGVTDSQWPLT